MDRIRDPRNHAAKTQILQLVQLSARENREANAANALISLMHDTGARPLVTSALASAMGSAPWVAERNTKIASGVLNTDTLAADAARFYGMLDNRSRDGVDFRQAFQKTFSQLGNHGVLKDGNSSFWKAMSGLEPQERLQFLQMTKACGVQESFELAPRDLMLGKLGVKAGSEKPWDAMLQVQLIKVGARQIASYRDLETQILIPIGNVHRSESGVATAVAHLRNAGSRNDALQRLSAVSTQIEALRGAMASLPEDSFVAGVQRAFKERAEILGEQRTFLTSDRPCAQMIEQMQRRTLEALRGMYRFIPYAAGGKDLRYPNLEARYRGTSPSSKSIPDQLAEAIQNIRSNIDTKSTSGPGNSGFGEYEASRIRVFLKKAEEILNLSPEDVSSAVSNT
ncbi:MAG: hypothetical protein LBT57_01770 [Puniceicoccales bacterium]|jgi:hypothetical protein|nr:hypothetical protein [Puniceicoccales bacterium]